MHINPRLMDSISITYGLIWEVSFATQYRFTKCSKCINIKTGRIIKQSYCGGSIGYYILGKFYSLNNLRNNIRKIKEYDCPF
jgi:hypothetical protein